VTARLEDQKGRFAVSWSRYLDKNVWFNVYLPDTFSKVDYESSVFEGATTPIRY